MTEDNDAPREWRPGMLRLFEKTKPKLAELPSTRTLFSTYLDFCADFLKEIAALEVKVLLNGIEDAKQNIFLNESYNVITAVAFIPEWNEHAFCRIDRLVLFRVLDSMFGGDPSMRTVTPERPLTSLEMSVALRIARGFLCRLSEALLEVVPFTCKSERLIEDGGASLPQTGSDMLLVKMQLAEFHDRIEIALPLFCLEMAHDKLVRQEDVQEVDIDPVWTETFRRSVGSATVGLVAWVEAPTMTLNEVSRLRPGSVLEFEGRRLQNVRLNSLDNAVFIGRLGQCQGVYTICIDKQSAEVNE